MKEEEEKKIITHQEIAELGRIASEERFRYLMENYLGKKVERDENGLLVAKDKEENSVDDGG